MDRKRMTLTKGNQKAFLIESDGVQNCYQDIKINEYSKLDFELTKKSDKWGFFEGSGVSVESNNRMYCIWGEGALEKGRTPSDSLHMPVSLKETWCKLEKRYIKAYNLKMPSSEFDHIDKHMVVLLGKSSDPLFINDIKATAPYPVGTAQYLFWCILFTSGWFLDDRFSNTWPDGVHDLETDKMNVLENLNQVQSFFGGMILWDSKNKRVALVDEKKYQQYGGFEVRYRKNMKGITRQENSDIATRIYPYGNNNLNIADVNGGKEYLDNFSFTTEIVEKIVNNNDIYSQESLLTWAKLQSEKLGRPRYNYSADLLILSDGKGYATPQPEAGQLGRIVDSEVVGTPVMQRILGVRRNVFREYDCQVEIGDVTTTFENTFKEIVKAKDFVKDTVTGIGRIPGGIIRGKTPALEKSEITLNETINVKEGAIYKKITSVDENLQTTISVTAGAIRTEVKDVKEGLQSSITQTASQIRTEVKNVKEGLQSSITQTAETINLRVDSTNKSVSNLSLYADKIEGRVTSVEGWSSTITQTAKDISLVVYPNGAIKGASIVAAVNNTGSSVKINADKITLSGDVVMKSHLKDGTTTISGDNITTGKISASLIDTDKVISGVLKVDRIRCDTYIYFGTSSAELRIGGTSGNAGKLIFGGYQVYKKTIAGQTGKFLYTKN